MGDDVDAVGLYLDGVQILTDAIASPEVAAAWDQPSVLEEQLVSGIAGHLARGGGWLVGEYLDATPADAQVECSGPGEYFESLMGAATEEAHRAIRARGADVAAGGRDALVTRLEGVVGDLTVRLRSASPSRPVAVAGGRVLRLDDYLATRIVEQVVHLDDLARSVGRDPWPVPERSVELTLEIGVDVLRRRSGDVAAVRSLYRSGFADHLPVL